MPQVVAGAAILGGASIAAGGIGAALGATGWIGALAQFGSGLILSGVSTEIAKRQSTAVTIQRGQTFTVREPVVPREFIFGKTRKGGVVAFIHTTGATNEYLHLVIMLAGNRCNSIGAVYFNGDLAIDAGGTPLSALAGLVTIDKRLGTPDQTAFNGLITDAPGYWTADHRLRGIACAYLRLKWDQDAFATGIPDIAFDLEGCDDVYDPRTTSTGYSTNAALCQARYLSDPVYGLGAAISATGPVVEADLIEAANICDEDVALDAGGTEKRYTCNGIFRASETPQSIIQSLLTASAGRAALQGSAWRLRAGAYRMPTVALTENDWRGGAMTLTTRRSASENFNGVRAQFVSPANDYQPDDVPPLQSAVYVAEDQGVERWSDVALRFTDSATTAQRIMKIHLERARRQQVVGFPGKLAAYRAAAGDTVTLDRPRWGFTAKPFEVHGLRLAAEDGQLLPDLVLNETSPLAYDWTASEEQIYAAAPRTNLPRASDIKAPGAPTLTESLYIARRNAVKSLIRAEWSASPSAFVAEYQVESRRSDDGDFTGIGWHVEGRTDQEEFDILDTAPGFWEVRVKALNAIGVSSVYSSSGFEALALSAPPVQLQNLHIQKAGGIAELSWDQSPDLDVTQGGVILIRHSASLVPSWQNSVSYRTVNGAMAVAGVPLKPGTYLIRARDTSGIRGPVTAISTKGIQAVAFASVQSLQEHPTFSGAKVNTEIDGVSLKLTDVTLPGTYAFPAGVDLASVRRVRVRSDIDVAALNLASNIDDRSENIDDWADFDDTEGAEIDVIVEMRVTDDDPAGSPTWSAWERLDSTEEEFRAAEFRATLTSSSTDFNVLLSGLRIDIEEVV